MAFGGVGPVFENLKDFDARQGDFQTRVAYVFAFQGGCSSGNDESVDAV